MGAHAETLATGGDFPLWPGAVTRGSGTAEILVRLGDGNDRLFHDFQTGGGLMARQVFALLAATVGTGTYMDERQVEGVVHLEVFHWS